MIDRTWLEVALSLWHRDGFVSPLVFAENKLRAVAAQPTSNEAMEVEDESKTLLVSALAASIDATHVGMVLEVWDREYELGQVPERLERGVLADLADTDPTIHTAIIVPWASVNSDESGILRARHTLTSEGEPIWEQTEHTDISSNIIEVLQRINEYGFRDGPETTIVEAVDIICGALGWTATWWEK